MKIVLVWKCSLDIEQYVKFQLNMLNWNVSFDISLKDPH